MPEVRTYMTAKAASELLPPDPRAPTAIDERGRSAQTFVVDAPDFLNALSAHLTLHRI